ncbi:T9SS type A sorting domain-containing protein [Fulvivirga sp. 29W222]|uniref:T9SS type A sorting domain-containing protein n=1 Tax=Fulvivirga marina TaxID=2494733 RepID=A0A937FWZ2_9BACT|nr:T9SS type A sorting domain-containing protein [Fulvivirga marina]MBL6447700.1 T9SS type A sorting domain-containing protein [Fulvivirga marina]
MKTIYYLFFLVVLITSRNVFSQDLCAPIGWATQGITLTGGGNASPVVVDTYDELKNALKSSSVKVVHVSGIINIPSGGRIYFQDQSDKTIFGLPGSKLVSSDKTSSGSGTLIVKRCKNIIIRNMTFEGPGAYDVDGYDNLLISDCANVWVDHCEFYDGLDGNFDINNGADLISVTWCKFGYKKAPQGGGSGGSNDHRFTNLIGSGDGVTGDRGKLRVTFKNCWWAPGCKARMPRVRFGKVHIVNNYFNSTASTYCIQAGFESNLLIEGNVFENVKNPIDLMNNTFTAVTERNNRFTGSTSGSKSGSGSAFTPPYQYNVANPNNIVTPITSCAGATLSGPGGCSSCGETNCTPTAITPYVQINGGSWSKTTTATVDAGSTVKFGPQPTSGGSWNWSGPNGFSATTREVTLSNTQSSGAGNYVATYTNSGGCQSTQTFKVTINCSSTAITPYVQINGGSWSQSTSATVDVGGSIKFGPQPISSGWSWSGPNGFSASTREVTLGNIQTSAAGNYIATFTNSSGCKSSQTFSVTVNAANPASLVKHGSGSSSQTVSLGQSINGFYYNWYYATTVQVTGVPQGINVAINNTDQIVSFSGAPTQTGTFKYTITTVGGSPNASKSATFTVNTTSSVAKSNSTDEGVNVPEVFPNPFELVTTFRFKVVQKGKVSIDIYSTSGTHIAEVVNDTFEAGFHQVAFKRGVLKSGIYIYVLESAQGTLRKRLIIE